MNLKRSEELGRQDIGEMDILLHSALNNGLNVMAPSIRAREAHVLAIAGVTELDPARDDSGEEAAGFRVRPVDDEVPGLRDQGRDPARDIAHGVLLGLFA